LTIFFEEIIKCNRAKLKVALQAGLKEDFPHSVEWYARDLCHLSAHPVVVEIDYDATQVKVNELDSVIHRSCHHSELARFQINLQCCRPTANPKDPMSSRSPFQTLAEQHGLD
jgi:hypothetical protein